MVTGVNSAASNIFTNQHDSLSRIMSSSGSSSESDLRDLSRKDTMSVNNISKDEIEYQIEDMMWDQDKELTKDEYERTFSLFQD